MCLRACGVEPLAEKNFSLSDVLCLRGLPWFQNQNAGQRRQRPKHKDFQTHPEGRQMGEVENRRTAWSFCTTRNLMLPFGFKMLSNF
jgi:hypothetical protein